MNSIPPMTDPMCRFWDQPDLSRILIDDTHAIMDAATFKALHDYSRSFPSGVYHGKMWRSRVIDGGCEVNVLRWYGLSDKPRMCSVNEREILIA